MIPENYHMEREGFFSRNRREILLILALIILILVAIWVYRSPYFNKIRNPKGNQQALTTDQSFPYSLILSLSSTVKDDQGIPYSGTVLYDPKALAYSYIATQDKGLVTPIGPSAFSSGAQYLALRANGDSNDFALYDTETLALARVIKNLPIGATVTSAIWSSDGQTFAYFLTGVPIPALIIDHVNPAITTVSPGADFPIGFSPDGSKILTRGRSVPAIINISDRSHRDVSGIGENTPETKFILSPSKEYLLAISSMSIQWYGVDWDAAALTSLGTVPATSNTTDATFAPDDSLIVKEQGNDMAQEYSYEMGQGVKLHASYKLSLPEGASILHVMSK